MKWVLPCLAAAALAGCASAPTKRDSLHELAAASGPRLAAQRSALGAVEVRGDRIAVLDGSLDLVVRAPTDRRDDGAAVHLHVLATPRGQPTGFDLCLAGRDLAEVVDELVDQALPPVVSALRDTPLLGATHAWSDTENGIAGHSGYLGRFRARGDVDRAAAGRLVEQHLLADLPPLPQDGRMHLMKVVALVSGGAWQRTVELDGGTLRADEPLGVRSEAAGAVVVFAVIDGTVDPVRDAGARREALQQLASRPSWLPDPATCPAKLVPAALELRPWDPVATRGGRLRHAIHGCQAGAVELCYAAAQALVTPEITDPASQSLFLRACQLGEASGCTNAAAGRRKQDDCAFATYEASCERGRDPWGCTMLGLALVDWEGRRDLARARQILPRACRLSDDDPACQAARSILQSLDRPPAAP